MWVIGLIEIIFCVLRRLASKAGARTKEDPSRSLAFVESRDPMLKTAEGLLLKSLIKKKTKTLYYWRFIVRTNSMLVPMEIQGCVWSLSVHQKGNHPLSVGQGASPALRHGSLRH